MKEVKKSMANAGMWAVLGTCISFMFILVSVTFIDSNGNSMLDGYNPMSGLTNGTINTLHDTLEMTEDPISSSTLQTTGTTVIVNRLDTVNIGFFYMILNQIRRGYQLIPRTLSAMFTGDFTSAPTPTSPNSLGTTTGIVTIDEESTGSTIGNVWLNAILAVFAIIFVVSGIKLFSGKKVIE